jgi:hypothetical protein
LLGGGHHRVVGVTCRVVDEKGGEQGRETQRQRRGDEQKKRYNYVMSNIEAIIVEESV